VIAEKSLSKQEFTSKTYAVSWDEMEHNVIDLTNQLASSGLDFLVFDVGSNPNQWDGWVVADKVRYFGHFYNSLLDIVKETKHYVFIYNSGDAASSDHPEFTTRVESMMANDDSVWLMAPNMVNDCDAGRVTMIAMSSMYPQHVLAIHLNGIWVALRRELAEVMLGFFEWMLKHGYMDFYKMISGHCLDTVYCAWTLFNNKKIYRDESFTMVAGTVTSHDSMTSQSDCTTVKNRFLEYVDELGHEPQKVVDIYVAMDDKVQHFPHTTSYSIEKAYPNLEDAEGFEF
jgi:hypothetical protein